MVDVKRPRLAVLDGLRLIAALAVLGYHYLSSKAWHTPRPFPELSRFSSYGFLGVELFFLISGFVICMSSWGRGLGEFFASRVARLYPAYFAAIVLTTLVLWVLPFEIHPLRLPQILVNFTMAQTGVGVPNVDGPYWTLWRELLFYLLFAIVVWRGVDYRRTVLFCTIWTAVSVITVTVPTPVLHTVVDPEYSMYFIAGVAMYLMHRFRPTALLWGIVVFSWLLAQYELSAVISAFKADDGSSLRWRTAVVVITLGFLAVLAVALGWFDRIQWRWLTTAGSLTYPLYLIHAFAGFAIINRLSPVLPRYVLLIGLVGFMLTVAWLIHRLVERPLSRLTRERILSGVADLRLGVFTDR